MKTLQISIIAICGIIIASTNLVYAEQTSPVIITQVELDSPFALYSENQTCITPPLNGYINNCLTDLVLGHKVKCTYFIGSKTCQPLHQFTNSTNHDCFNYENFSSAPQWFDVYNTQNTTAVLQNFTVIEKWNHQPYGHIGPYSTVLELKPHEKCTIGFTPINEPLAVPLNNMIMDISYNYDNKDYNASTSSFSDTYNDIRTWQYDGNKWTFVEENSVKVPEFPFAVSVLVISVASLLVFYRMKFKI